MSNLQAKDPREVSTTSDWALVRSVLEGAARPPADPAAIKLVRHFTQAPCDVRIGPTHVEIWHAAYPEYERHPAELAAGIVHHVMRLVGTPRLTESYVVVIDRTGLGAPIPDRERRALWIVPGSEQVDILVREPLALGGPRVGIPVPPEGAWRLPEPLPRSTGTLVAATFPCPHCNTKPEHFEEIPDEGAFRCLACGQTFVPRISRF